MGIFDAIFRGIQLSLGFSLARSAASNARISVRTFRRMVDRGQFEVVDSQNVTNPQDGLKMAGYGGLAATQGYLALRLIEDAVS
jgi:hypothetical protein